MAKKENTASVLAFEKKLVPSDGFMYGTIWEKRYDNAYTTSLSLKEKSVRGTISNRLKKAIANDDMKIDAEVQKANLQRVDSCALSAEQDTLKIHFTLKILQGVENPSACNNEEFNKTYTLAVQNYIKQNGFKELSKRYATNIANGRFLWRNRVGTEEIEIQIKVLNKGREKEWKFNAKEISISSFDGSSTGFDELADMISDTLSGKNEFLLLEINAFAKIGNAQDVYPSEELVLDKSPNNKEKKSKILYEVNGIAGMHSQKLGNALRTIDTWYPEYDERNMPIAIEPYGSVTNLGKAFRKPKEKTDFFTLFDKFARGEALDNVDDEHYVMAILVRGGVFGESSK